MMTNDGMSPVFDLAVDVGRLNGVPGPTLQIAASVFMPPDSAIGASPTVIFAVPGGGYSKGYFDMEFPGHQNYSEACYHRSHGFIFVACDHIGVGASSMPDPLSIDFAMLGDCYDAAVRGICDKLRTGSLMPDRAAIASLTRIGIGQSMGGIVTILAQGRRSTFDAIGVLGASAIHTVLPQRDARAREACIAAHVQPRGSAVDLDSVARSSHSIADFVYPFHFEDVPQDILQADIGGGYPLRRSPVPPFASATIPPCAVTMMSPGCVAPEAAAVRVPVFIGVGERDTCPEPRAEPRAYANSSDVSVYVVPRMAHMHNFASTRQLLWDRIEHWARGIAAEPPH
jgi:hypothetical protein